MARLVKPSYNDRVARFATEFIVRLAANGGATRPRDVAQPETASHTAFPEVRPAKIVAWSIAFWFFGCSGSGPGPGTVVRDAGPDGSMISPASSCTRTCDAHEVCSRGRCTSNACADAELDIKSVVGCLFYAVEAENVDSDSDRAASVLITNPGNDTAKVVLQFPVRSDKGEREWLVLSGTSIPRVSSRRLSLSGRAVRETGVFPTAGVRVSSDRPVTVALVQSDDRNPGEVASSGGTQLWPFQSIGPHYRVMTYPQRETLGVGATSGSRGGAGRLVVVATEAQTHVTVTPADGATAVSTGLTTLGGEIVLDDGDVLHIRSDGDGADLSGSEIRADRPIAVFSGNVTTTYGATAAGINSPDMTIEQMPPIRAWSTTYVAAALPPQADTCDPLLGTAGASIWRIVAAEDGTRVDFTGPSGVVGLPASTIMLDAGAVWPMVVSGGSFTVKANKPVLATQGIDCEPTLSLGVSADALLEDLLFATLANFEHVAAVVRPEGDEVTLDGSPLGDSLFRPAGNGFEVASVPLPRCPGAEGACTHRLQGKFGVSLRGMDVLASWALTFPAWATCADPSDGACLIVD